MIHIRQFTEQDFSSVKDIYQQGIDTGNATFQEKAKDWHEWNDAMLGACRLVAVQGEHIVGWAALSPVSSRAVYAGIAEVSVYVANQNQGQGIGHKLLSQLIQSSEANNIWTLQAGIFPENTGSIAIHQKNGFRIVGTREKVGKMDQVWRDSVFMERRSTIAGI
jgi:L-amino acid N-acyltransferase YncA